MKKRSTILVIFLTVFIDLVGFGIVLPLLPIYSRDFGASGLLIGAIMASYSAMQFIFAPIWGRLSDRVGRRPILLMSLAGGAISYATFALASGMTGNAALIGLFVSRMFAGIFGANITVAQAYIADVTPPEKRSKGMGMIGMAFGLGFILGPALGSMTYQWFGITGPGWVAMGFCLLSFLMALTVLKESWNPKDKHELAGRRPRMEQWKATMGQPVVGLLILIFFLATFGFTCFETTLGLLIGDNFNSDPTQSKDANLIGYLFAYCGLIGAMVQGGMIGRLVKKYGEPNLITASLVIFAVSMAPLPFIKGQGFLVWFLLLVALGLLAIGASLTRPPVFGLLSLLTPSHEQGVTIGVAQSAGSLARILGPLFAGLCYEQNPALPYVTVSVLAMMTGVFAWKSLRRVDVAALTKKVEGKS
jgi:multidrug resistance protein